MSSGLRQLIELYRLRFGQDFNGEVTLTTDEAGDLFNRVHAALDRICQLETSLQAAVDFATQPNDMSDEMRAKFWERLRGIAEGR